jgi:Dynamin GTPase effector domain
VCAILSHSFIQTHCLFRVIVNNVLKECYDTTLKYIEWLLRVEQSVFTLNEHYYSDYKDKFLAYYRGSRQKNKNRLLVETINGGSNGQQHCDDSIKKIMSGLSELGVDNVSITDIAKILSPDPYEPALHIMSGVRAYFQGSVKIVLPNAFSRTEVVDLIAVAYKRFSDTIPMAIDQELLCGLDWDRSIEKALLKGLGVSGPNAHQCCEALLQEPPNVMVRREELTKKRERLESAKEQLMSLF